MYLPISLQNHFPQLFTVYPGEEENPLKIGIPLGA